MNKSLINPDEALCLLHSLGVILIALCDPDRERIDYEVLADLGRVISKEAMAALDLLHEIQEQPSKREAS